MVGAIEQAMLTDTGGISFQEATFTSNKNPQYLISTVDPLTPDLLTPKSKHTMAHGLQTMRTPAIELFPWNIVLHH